jgi:hypothetical protein
MTKEENILQLSWKDEENHDVDMSQRDLFEELKTWRKEYARWRDFLNKFCDVTWLASRKFSAI